MNKRRSRSAPAVSLDVEALDRRIVPSGMASGLGSAGALHQGAVEVAAQTLQKAPTHMTLAITTGTLGQPVAVSVTVRAPASAGSPVGTVNITDQGHVIQTLTLSPTTSTDPKSAISVASGTLTPQPGGGAYFFGKHSLSATFVPSGSFMKSSSRTTFTVSQPSYTALANGVQIATIVPGSGAPIQSGQTANVLYTGYLARNGRIFDDSNSHGGTPLSFALGAQAVIPGFDAGTVGMQVGESRIILIPPAEGYGRAANGPIPGNSTLIFVVTLESIS